MVYLLIGLGVIVAIIGVIFIAGFVARGRAPEIDMENLEVGMPQLAQEAVEMAKYYKIELDGKEDSITKVEDALARGHEDLAKQGGTDGAGGIAMAFGAYIGEVIRKVDPSARWEKDSEVAGPNSYPLHWRGGQIFPTAWCYKRLVNGPEDNVLHKYQVCKRERT